MSKLYCNHQRQTFTFLQHEGFLMQGCFKSSLRGLHQAPAGDLGTFYSAFFNYAIGLERLLKVVLMLDRWHDERKLATPDIISLLRARVAEEFLNPPPANLTTS